MIASTRIKEEPILQWPEFSSNFNQFWVHRGDIYERWRQNYLLSPSLPATAAPSSTRNLNPNASGPLPPVAGPVLNPPIRPLISQPSSIPLHRSSTDESAGARVLEAELVEISERLRQTRYQLDEEKQKRHQIRDELEEARRQIEDERNRHRDVLRQVVLLEEDKLTHEIQVARLREQIEQNISLKESLQLDLDRARMQLFHAKEKYETALSSVVAENESLRKKIDVLNLEIQDAKASGNNRKDMLELESQNAVLRQVLEKYRRALPNSRFADTADAVSTTAFEEPKLAGQTEFVNSLMEALDKAKFLNRQMHLGSVPDNKWSTESWQDLCLGWRETVCELCDLFATAHRLESQKLTNKLSS